MKPDRTTKLIFAAIAVFLGIIAYNGTGGAASPALAQQAGADPKFNHIQLSGDADGFYLFDKVGGRIWFYPASDFRGRPNEIGKLEEPGGRLAR